ncbi:uncharacterized protein EKO05_0010651 [Ascochyta rabiei]|uniref:uncharacterized protein n=1 Tax=Didymella rabiei TaxID=5454 RepID=UPI002202696E|nr:uncharacterized protein EKO05_0010651 [Ascochyta rabiei]UPX20419.1 hypothetical protein EKO05_0010651 [Ascochyta rabiei]
MPEIVKRAGRRFHQHFNTPPPVYVSDEASQQHLHTPQRSAILGILHFCDVHHIPCSFKDIKAALNIPHLTAYEVAQSKEPRTLHHSNHSDAQGAPRQLTGANAHAIVDYLDHCQFEKKAETWQDIQVEAGVIPQGGKEAYSRITI